MYQDEMGNHLPLIFIACTAEINPAFVHFARNAKKDKQWKYVELTTGHDAMLTAPRETATLIESFAE